MDGLKRQDRKQAEEVEEVLIINEAEESLENEQETYVEPPKKERRSFLDKLTERVKEFLDNAE